MMVGLGLPSTLHFRSASAAKSTATCRAGAVKRGATVIDRRNYQSSNNLNRQRENSQSPIIVRQKTFELEFDYFFYNYFIILYRF